MKIAYITAGAAGMYCGSCMKDNTLATSLNRLGHETLLIPTYTPIRTDEEDVSQHRVFFGGINVYLQQKFWLFRHTPWLMDRLLDFPRLLRWVSRFAVKTQAEKLGDLAVSMLLGDHGKQRKEAEKLVKWLADELRPDVVILTNVLLSGFVPLLRERWNGAILATLQGDDIFLDALPEADRIRCKELIQANCRGVEGYLVTSAYYADYLSEYLGLPREQMHIVYPGIDLKGYDGDRAVREQPPYTIGYFARICPEKGFHHLVSAFIRLKSLSDVPPCRLRVSGWLGENHRPFFDGEMRRLRDAGLASEVEHVESPTRADKIRFLQTLDLLSVPTVYREPKGIYLLESWANGVPVVLPAHGSFPELVEATGGGLLVEPGNDLALAEGWLRLLIDPDERTRMAQSARRVVSERFSAESMARETLRIAMQYHKKRLHSSEVIPA